ncbi:MAG: hypothetical protein MZV63_52525 [Marinilabiliales bacterium]|nr:hypothetical protein [Marinilabiliales bacterium]
MAVLIPASALKELELSGLRGRGGAGFPFHLKVRSSRDARADRSTLYAMPTRVIPEPSLTSGSLKSGPHSVLFGMLMTGIITGADTGVVYIRGEYPLAVSKTEGGCKAA